MARGRPKKLEKILVAKDGDEVYAYSLIKCKDNLYRMRRYEIIEDQIMDVMETVDDLAIIQISKITSLLEDQIQ